MGEDLALSMERAHDVSAAPQDEAQGVETDGVDDGVDDGVESGAEDAESARDGYLDGQEEDSFPASDPHSDWSGPPERD
jgi:hypothetical protein